MCKQALSFFLYSMGKNWQMQQFHSKIEMSWVPINLNSSLSTFNFLLSLVTAHFHCILELFTISFWTIKFPDHSKVLTSTENFTIHEWTFQAMLNFHSPFPHSTISFPSGRVGLSSHPPLTWVASWMFQASLARLLSPSPTCRSTLSSRYLGNDEIKNTWTISEILF